MSAIGMRTFMVLIAMFLFGCASRPMTFEERRALYAVGVGLQNAGAIVGNSRTYYQPLQYNPMCAPVFNPVPIASPPVQQTYQIDTPRYQMFNGASPGQIHY